MEGKGGGARSVRSTRKAEIDTSAPFRSVKEAVMLFGDTVLAGELYSTKLKRQMDNNIGPAKNDVVPTELAELKETKKNLEKAQGESLIMATCLSSLQHELEQTKKELQQLKYQKKEQSKMEEEELKSIDVATKFELKRENINNKNNNVEFQHQERSRYATFASPLADVILPESDDATPLEIRLPYIVKKEKKKTIANKKKKNKSFGPLIVGFLSSLKNKSG